MLLLALHVSDYHPPSSGAPPSKLYHAFGTFVQACLARHACTNVPTTWYSLIDSASDDERVVRPKHVEEVKTLEE